MNNVLEYASIVVLCIIVFIFLHGVYGPYFFESTITGVTYGEKLTQYFLPGAKMQWENFQEMYFMQDGAPAHTSNIIHDLLNLEFNGCVTGRRGYIDWPPRSPDLTCMDFCFWGIVKDSVYAKKPINLEQLSRYIEEAFEDIELQHAQCKRVIGSIPERLQNCINVEGFHFERLN